MNRHDIPEYRSWRSMKTRCYNPNRPEYAHYGGRGIVVCDEWKNDFLAFYRDMGTRPSKLHSIDRIDVNGNYGPGNCRWATPWEQNRNQRTNKWVNWHGRTLLLEELCVQRGVSYSTVRYRLKVGMDLRAAVCTPLTRRSVRATHCANGHSLDDAYIRNGRKRCRICRRALDAARRNRR